VSGATAARTHRPIALGALVSGAGRSVLNLHAAIARGDLNARLAVVIGTRDSVPALEKCRTLGIPTMVVPADPAASLDDRLDQALHHQGVELVCLCGYLRRFRVDAWRGRALNIHPALLPDFGGPGMYGAKVHQAVLDSGRTSSGCTVHWVDEDFDHGPVLLQRPCPVLPGDTPQTLAERVFALECEAYPAAVALAARTLRESARSAPSPPTS
jgi:folate-dependent phosphoribosylglycinamide formyltransferase PurN